MPAGNEIAVYSNYLAAQKAVDALSDAGFEVQTVTIVGHDLHMVERVTGRLTYPRVAFAGFASGAWFGLFVGLLMSLFSGGTEVSGAGQFGAILPAMLIGGGFGLLFSVISYALQRGKRDFTSQSQIVAARYVLLCDPTTASKGRAILAEKGMSGDAIVQRPPTVVSRPVDPSVPPAYGVRAGSPAAPATPVAPAAPAPGGVPAADGILAPDASGAQSGQPASQPEQPAARPMTYGEALDAQRKAEREAALSAQTPLRAAEPEVPVVETVAAPSIKDADSVNSSPASDTTAPDTTASDATSSQQPREFAPPAEPPMTRRQLRNPDNPFSPPVDED